MAFLLASLSLLFSSTSSECLCRYCSAVLHTFCINERREMHPLTQGAQCSSKARLDGKIVAITGCNTGIGKFTALDMSRRGAKVVMLCRNVEAAEVVAEEIRKATEGEVIVHRCDLASLKSVRECSEQLSNSLEKIDILINNAGVMTCPLTRTEDGFEMQIGTNHFGHFLLTNLVMPLVKKAAPGARIVNVSSLAHDSGVMQWDDINWNTTTYSPIKVIAYFFSELGNFREHGSRMMLNGDVESPIRRPTRSLSWQTYCSQRSLPDVARAAG